MIDIAVPRDLDPELNNLDNVYLYDIDDLQQVVDVNKAERDKEAARGESIVAEETMKFSQWLEGMEVSPTIVELRRKAEQICQAEINRTLNNLKNDLPDKAKVSIEKMASAIVGKMLHDPINYLKGEDRHNPDRRQKLAMVRQLFGLDRDRAE